jgi:hypothetical protein
VLVLSEAVLVLVIDVRSELDQVRFAFVNRGRSAIASTIRDFAIYNLQFHFFNRSPISWPATCRRSAACRAWGGTLETSG